MDCRGFRRRHFAYLDDTLPAMEMAAMQRHVLECDECARHDTQIRRSLLVARNLPAIRPSADFTARLHARLAAERRLPPAPPFRGPGLRVFLAMAASIVGIGVLASEARSRFESPEVRLAVADAPVQVAAPAGADAPAPTTAGRPDATEPVADAMLMASASAGMPVWPALVLAQEAPMQFARVQFRLAAASE
jgi:hypothetical protein